MISLSFQQTIELLKRIDPEHHIPVLIGPPGLAKTACAKQFCKEAGIPPERQAFLSIALNDTGDIVGFPYKITSTDNASDSGRMGFAVPPWWLGQYDPVTLERRPLEFIHRPYDDGFKYCLSIDEANRDADPQKQAAMINLFLERNIQGRFLPRNTYIILSINEGDDYLVEDFDPAVKNRILRISFKPTISEWLIYFKKSPEYNLMIDKFLEVGGGKRHFYPQDSALSEPQFCSPRSLSKLGALMNNFECGDDFGVAEIVYTNSELWTILKAGIFGIIGDNAGKDFISYLDDVAQQNKSKINIPIPPKYSQIYSLMEIPPQKQLKQISSYTPLDINELMLNFVEYLGSEFFKGWNSELKELGQSIISASDVPNENKLLFIEKCKAIENTNAFDLYQNNLMKEISNQKNKK
jgi:hypothetical protein